jgi:hypothetical protein
MKNLFGTLITAAGLSFLAFAAVVGFPQRAVAGCTGCTNCSKYHSICKSWACLYPGGIYQCTSACTCTGTGSGLTYRCVCH